MFASPAGEFSMGRSAGSGNAAWKASRMMTRCRRGNINRRRCNVVRKDGSQCHGVAVRGYGFCYVHSGRWVVARRKLRRRNLKYSLWTVPRSQQKSVEQLTEEAKANFAALSDFPQSRDV